MKSVKCWRFGKWAWHFEKCIVCGNNKCDWNNRHKGNGLCVKCYDRKRGQKENRKIYKHQAHIKWWTRVKARKAMDDDFRKMMNEKVYKWQKQKPRLHRKNWKKMALKNSFKNFLIKKNKNKTKKGIEILIDGHRVKTNILPPSRQESDMDRVVLQSQLFREVYNKIKQETYQHLAPHNITEK